jgi:ribokinase
MVGAIGRDSLGEAARANLVGEGIDVSGIASLTEPTGCAFITIDDRGENAIAVASGANRLASATSLPSREVGASEIPDIYVMRLEVPLDPWRPAEYQ